MTKPFLRIVRKDFFIYIFQRIEEKAADVLTEEDIKNGEVLVYCKSSSIPVVW